MKPIDFPERNLIFAKDQSQYLPLPAHRAEDGTVTSCWEFSWKEKFKILFGAKVYWRQMTFHQPLQPVRPSLKFKD